MKNLTSKLRGRTELELAMTPMIDVVFLLLIFFLATASFEVVERSMPTGISEPPPAVVQQSGSIDDILDDLTEQSEEIVITIDQDPASPTATYTFNRNAISGPSEIGNKLAAVIKIRPDMPVVVDPTGVTSMGLAMQVYDLAKGAGALEVFFAVE